MQDKVLYQEQQKWHILDTNHCALYKTNYGNQDWTIVV